MKLQQERHGCMGEQRAAEVEQGSSLLSTSSSLKIVKLKSPMDRIACSALLLEKILTAVTVCPGAFPTRSSGKNRHFRRHLQP